MEQKIDPSALTPGVYVNGERLLNWSKSPTTDTAWAWVPAGPMWSNNDREHFWDVIRRHKIVCLEHAHVSAVGLLWCAQDGPHVLHSWVAVEHFVQSDINASDPTAQAAAEQRAQAVLTELFHTQWPANSPAFVIGAVL